MRKVFFVLFMFVFGINLIFGEVIILNDDSVIKGKITKLDEDNIVFLGEFGEMIVERSKIKQMFGTEAEYNSFVKERERLKEEMLKRDAEFEKKQLEETLRLEKERSEALLREKAEKEKVEKEKSEKKEETKKEESIFVRKPLLGGGAALISIGGASLIAGGALLGVTLGYFRPLVAEAKNNGLDYIEYEKAYNTFLGGLIAGSVCCGVGVIMVAAGIPMTVYTKKNVSLNLEVGTTTTFSFSYKF